MIPKIENRFLKKIMPNRQISDGSDPAKLDQTLVSVNISVEACHEV
jgi:hypothetical protein